MCSILFLDILGSDLSFICMRYVLQIHFVDNDVLMFFYYLYFSIYEVCLYKSLVGAVRALVVYSNLLAFSVVCLDARI